MSNDQSVRLAGAYSHAQMYCCVGSNPNPETTISSPPIAGNDDGAVGGEVGFGVPSAERHSNARGLQNEGRHGLVAESSVVDTPRRGQTFNGHRTDCPTDSRCLLQPLRVQAEEETGVARETGVEPVPLHRNGQVSARRTRPCTAAANRVPSFEPQEVLVRRLLHAVGCDADGRDRHGFARDIVPRQRDASRHRLVHLQRRAPCRRVPVRRHAGDAGVGHHRSLRALVVASPEENTVVRQRSRRVEAVACDRDRLATPSNALRRGLVAPMRHKLERDRQRKARAGIDGQVDVRAGQDAADRYRHLRGHCRRVLPQRRHTLQGRCVDVDGNPLLLACRNPGAPHTHHRAQSVVEPRPVNQQLGAAGSQCVCGGHRLEDGQKPECAGCDVAAWERGDRQPQWRRIEHDVHPRLPHTNRDVFGRQLGAPVRRLADNVGGVHGLGVGAAHLKRTARVARERAGVALVHVEAVPRDAEQRPAGGEASGRFGLAIVPSDQELKVGHRGIVDQDLNAVLKQRQAAQPSLEVPGRGNALDHLNANADAGRGENLVPRRTEHTRARRAGVESESIQGNRQPAQSRTEKLAAAADAFHWGTSHSRTVKFTTCAGLVAVTGTPDTLAANWQTYGSPALNPEPTTRTTRPSKAKPPAPPDMPPTPTT
eukprot:1590363-Rhodomonas_salina.1